MNLVSVAAGTPVPHANAKLVDAGGLERELRAQMEGEVRFDAVLPAPLYSTDAQRLSALASRRPWWPKSREDLIRIVRIATQFSLPYYAARAAATAPGRPSRFGAGASGGLRRKYFNRVLELNVAERLGGAWQTGYSSG